MIGIGSFVYAQFLTVLVVVAQPPMSLKHGPLDALLLHYL